LPLDVFTVRNFVADFVRLKLNFIQKTTNSLLVLEPPLGGVRDIDVKNINLQIKNIKSMFLHLYENIFKKTCIKTSKMPKKHKKYMFFKLLLKHKKTFFYICG